VTLGVWQLVLGSTVLGSVLSGLVAFLLRRLEVRRYAAELTKLEAEAAKLTAETDDLTSTRLIKELDAISARNAELATIVSRQSDKIDALRADIFKYAQREADHAIENATLKERIKILEASSAAPIEMKQALNLAFPVPESPRAPNEFESDEQE
jgi:outer membrane murein-binding lipoprotein Lpp